MFRSFLVVGSINIDLNVRVPRLPEAGETLTGSSFSTAYGGKGANQAVALARLCQGSSNKVQLAGKIGTDTGGSGYREYLRENGVDISMIGESRESTGTALIEIDDGGNNRIVVVPGANGDIDCPWWDGVSASLGTLAGTAALFQLELPLPVVCRGIEGAHASGATVILDPAPAVTLPDGIMPCIDYITPNQGETSVLTGIYPKTDGEAAKASGILLERGVGAVLIKAGSLGAWFFSKREAWFCPSFPVRVMDTTAAGDSFNAGFAWALGRDYDVPDALRFACAVGGLSTTRAGAQAAMPDLNNVSTLLQANPKTASRRL